jgi:co-chaperonin GroES (HSP10)
MTDFTHEPITVDTFRPNPGYLLIDPLDAVITSSLVKTVDPSARSHVGIVVCIGDPKIDEGGNVIACPNKEGQRVAYSVMGCEKQKMRKGDDSNHEFVIAPFSRVLGGWHE